MEQALAAADRDVFCRILNSASSGVPTTSSSPLISMICPEKHFNWMAFLLVEGLGEFPSKADGKIVAACCIFIVARAVLVGAIGEVEFEMEGRLKTVRKLLGEVGRFIIILFGTTGSW